MIEMNHVSYYFLFPKGASRGYGLDRYQATAIQDQQSTVGHTNELSLPIKSLPGEDDIKLREGTIRISKSKRR